MYLQIKVYEEMDIMFKIYWLRIKNILNSMKFLSYFYYEKKLNVYKEYYMYIHINYNIKPKSHKIREININIKKRKIKRKWKPIQMW